MNVPFTISDLKNAIPSIEKSHPFLPDRKWLLESLDEKLELLLNEINQGVYSFSSMKTYFEWQEKPTPAIQMSTPDWLVHFVLLEKLEQSYQSFFFSNSAYQISKMDNLLDKSRVWKNENSKHWILKTDIKSFFKNIQHDFLLKNLEEKISNSILLKLLNQYLASTEKAMRELETTSSDLYTHHSSQGLPIGAELNYFLASSYLYSIDHILTQADEVIHFVRYVDDILIFSKDEDEIQKVKTLLENNLKKIGLQLNFEKTIIQNGSEPIRFLRQEI